MNSALLQGNSLCKSYAVTRRRRRIVASESVTFHLVRGELLGLTGHSGCGKTTLLRCIFRIEPADAGEVLFDNRNVFLIISKLNCDSSGSKLSSSYEIPRQRCIRCAVSAVTSPNPASHTSAADAVRREFRLYPCFLS